MAEEKKKIERHLTLKEAKHLFPDYEALDGFIITCSPLPLKSTLHMTDKSKEAYRKVMGERVAHLGLLVLSAGDNKRGIKEGEILSVLAHSQSHTSVKREIKLLDCSPHLRGYEINLFNVHDFGMRIKQN